MNLADAQAARSERGDASLELAIDVVLDRLEDARTNLSNADRVGPAAREKLKGILKKYAKSAHPFADCVRDNRKRFGTRAENVCAVVKDIIRGTTKWRGNKKLDKGAPGVKGLSMGQCPIVDMDDDVITLLEQYADLDVPKILELEVAS